jgi:regulatory protein
MENIKKEEKKKYERKKMGITDYIFFLLSRRDYSYKEIYDKLIKREEDPKQIKEKLQWMQENNYQSDERMAENYYKNRKHKKGNIVIFQELKMKGIHPDIINRVIKDYNNEEDNLDNALNLVVRFKDLDLNDRKIQDKILRKIVSRGFSFDIAKKVMIKLKNKN